LFLAGADRFPRGGDVVRVRNWIPVVISVVLLIMAGVVGIVVNRSALRAADAVHRADSRALGVNNATLAGQLQLLSAAELNDFAVDHPLSSRAGDPATYAALVAYTAKSNFFRYGAAVTDLKGDVLNATRFDGLPMPSDPALTPLRNGLRAGQPGFSSVMVIDGSVLTAVGVPVRKNGVPVGVLIGFNQMSTTQLQGYVSKLSSPTDLITVVDSSGRVVAATDRTRAGSLIDPSVIRSLRADPSAHFVGYRSGGTDYVAVVVGGMPGGWAYVRVQTKADFDGAVHSRNQTLTVTLLAMLLIGVLGFALLGYRAQVQRRRSDERFRALIQHAPDVVAVLDETGRVQYASPSAARLLGAEDGAYVGASIFDLVHPEDQAGMLEKLGLLLSETDLVLRLQCRVRTEDGTYRWFEFTASNQMDNPALAGVVINARDVTDQHEFQERLSHEALHDPLTGLPNRRRMHDALGQALGSGPVGVLFVDLDGFKPINDTYGHEAGDELLQQVAARLKACVREEDVLARVGGDEFVLLMPGAAEPVDATAMRDRMLTVLRRPFRLSAGEVHIGASVGVHTASPHTDPDEALRAADDAMYAIKRAASVDGPRRR
jgi:diguanylate cyclase (GGDEF)-like protein/PAS domain S-box-containing protein